MRHPHIRWGSTRGTLTISHYCHNKGFGINNLDYITVNGPTLDAIRHDFVKPARGPGFYQGRGNRTWLVNGPHDGADINQDYLGGLEETVSPVEGDLTGGYTWTTFSDIDDYMNLAAYYGAPANCVTYAFTRIIAKAETTARLRFGADDGIKIWLNGTPVYTNGSTGGWSLVQQDIPITLQVGVNRLLVKIKNTFGDYGFSMFVSEPDGDTPMGIRYSTLAADVPEISSQCPRERRDDDGRASDPERVRCPLRAELRSPSDSMGIRLTRPRCSRRKEMCQAARPCHT